MLRKLAQLVERLIYTEEVFGSKPAFSIESSIHVFMDIDLYKQNQSMHSSILFSNVLSQILPVYSVRQSREELILNVPSALIVPVIYFLRDHTNSQFKVLCDICAVDYPKRHVRFEIVYNLLSITFNTRLRVCIQVNEMTPLLSVSSLFRGANWFEREIWDLFGIFFFNHPDLRPLLTDYGFEGSALKKDFPMSGYVEVFFSVKDQRLCFTDLEVDQQARHFTFLSPWSVGS